MNPTVKHNCFFRKETTDQFSRTFKYIYWLKNSKKHMSHPDGN